VLISGLFVCVASTTGSKSTCQNICFLRRATSTLPSLTRTRYVKSVRSVGCRPCLFVDDVLIDRRLIRTYCLKCSSDLYIYVCLCLFCVYMSACLCLSTCVYVCLSVSVSVCICLPVCVCVCVYMSACLCLCIRLPGCVCVYMSACVCLPVYICLPVCVCKCMCVLC